MCDDIEQDYDLERFLAETEATVSGPSGLGNEGVGHHITSAHNVLSNRPGFPLRDQVSQKPLARSDLPSGLSGVGHGINGPIDAVDLPLIGDSQRPAGGEEWGVPYTALNVPVAPNSIHSSSRTGQSDLYNNFDLTLAYLPGTGNAFANNTSERRSGQSVSSQQASYPVQEDQFWPASYVGGRFENDASLHQNQSIDPNQFQKFPQWHLDRLGQEINVDSSTDPLDLVPLLVAHKDASESRLGYDQMTFAQPGSSSLASGNGLAGSSGPRPQSYAEMDLLSDPLLYLSADIPEASRAGSEGSWEQVTQPTPSSAITEGSHVIVNHPSVRRSVESSNASTHLSETGILLPRENFMAMDPYVAINAAEGLEAVPSRANEPQSTSLLPLGSWTSHNPSIEAPGEKPFVSGFRIIDDSSATVTAQKRKRTLAKERRPITKAIRLMGACVRCKMMKEKCSLGTPCERCEKELNDPKFNHGLCFRESLKEVKLVRLGSGKVNQPRLTYIEYQWTAPNAPPKLIQLSWELPDKTLIELPTLQAPLHEFSPRKRDLLYEEWQVDGELKKVSLPPYATRKNSDLWKNLYEFMAASRPKVHEMMLNSIEDPLTRLTFQEADRYQRVHGSEVISLAFRIRTTAILSAGWGSIIGDETLGTPNVDSADKGYCGRYPLPVPLTHQIDLIFVDTMEDDERKLVGALNKMLFERKAEAWFEIFLAYFIIMTHLKFIHTQAVGFMRSRERTASGGQVSYIVKEMVAKWDASAGNMLYYFNHILNGERPFAVAVHNLAEVRQKGNLDDGSTAYIKEVLSVLDESGNSPGTPFSEREDDKPSDRWIYQLFRKP